MLSEPLISITLDKHEQVHHRGRRFAANIRSTRSIRPRFAPSSCRFCGTPKGKGTKTWPFTIFERLRAEDMLATGLHELRRFHTVLPNSPLSYEGVLVKIRWCVRVRVFLRNGRDFIAERGFQLGEVPYAQAVLS